MGKNFYVDVSDVLTDAFDVLGERLMEKNPSNARKIKKYTKSCRARADAAFRAEYKRAEEFLDYL